MATVRIYKIAELLGLSSQEAIALLKEDTGIAVKSASSSIEEIVARQFVERHAKKRAVALPRGPLFSDKPSSRKGRSAKAEPPAPAAPKLRPRLVKTVKPKPEPDAEAESETTSAPEVEPAAPVTISAEAETAAATEPQATVAVEDEVESTGGAAEAVAAETSAAPEAADQDTPETLPAATPAEPPAQAAQAEVQEAEAEAPAVPEAKPPTATRARRPSRVVPPSRRLRIEDPLTGEAPAARPMPQRPAIRPKQSPPAPTRPALPPPPSARPPSRPMSPSVRPPLGGPRPLPAQPVRPTGHMPGRPPGFRQPPRPTGPRRRRVERPSAPAPPVPLPPITRLVTLAEGMSVKDLADKLEVKVKDVLRKLIERRMMLTINSTLDAETAELISRDFGAEVVMRSFEEELTEVETEASAPEDMIPRAPVVTVMGHVDHGKTTLLDGIRETKVAEGEAGGITQHIGAYSVDVSGRRVVFLDTPGHEAFTLMRARGARVTDIVVLVVAADDGVMPQTREAIDHAKAAKVPIVVAVNKIDKPDANPERVKRELTELGLMPEEWGGTTVTVEVSARQRQNLDQLLEMILLVADLGEHKANPKRMAQGTVLEAKLDRGRGPVATVLVQDGTVAEGDLFIAGTVDGKVRALFDHLGRKVKKVGPATPVEVLGLSALPQPGDLFQVIDDPIKARQVVTYRQAKAKEKALVRKGGRLTLESLQQQMTEGGVKELPVIIKADVQGSAEVLADSLDKLSDERVKVRTIHSGVGAVNESDVLLASASNAIIIAFNVRPDRNAAEVAEREEVDIRPHSVIYNVTDELKKAMAGLLEPTLKETRLGSAEVRQTFKTPKVGTVAGCLVMDGKVIRSGDAQARLLRDNVVVWTGKLSSLRRFKDDVSEVTSGTECGIGLERFNDIKVGDVIEAFTIEKIAQTV